MSTGALSRRDRDEALREIERLTEVKAKYQGLKDEDKLEEAILIREEALAAEKAIRDQYVEAVKRNTVTAYQLFISRYPDHPLASDAEKRLDSVLGSPRR